MKLTVKLTLDGLVRALRGLAHDLAERIDSRVETGGDAPPRKIKGGRDAIGP